MIKIGLACRQFYEEKKDGMGIYTKELSSTLAQEKKIKVLNIPIKYYSPSLISTFLLKTPYYHNAHLKKKIDLLHVTDYRIPKITTLPVIATLHDAIPLKYPEWVNQKWRRLKNFGMIYSAKWLTHVIALSHFAVPDLVKYWKIPEEKISVIYPGISKKWFAPISQTEKMRILDKYNIQGNFFLFVGTLQPRKNVERILSAYHALPKEIKNYHSLILVGQSGWKNETLLKEIQKLTDSGYGKWINYIPETDIKALYQSASAFIFPSLYEGFGLPVLEAFASNVPVITSSNSAMSEIANNCAILIDPHSIEALNAALIKLSENSTLQNNLKIAAQQKASEFTWEKCAAETLKVYRTYVGNGLL